jgi:adenylate kinase family enzyme
MKIHITSASGAGSTTLGLALSETLNYPYFDSDRYYWENSVIPFTQRRDPPLRNAMLKHDLDQHEHCILGGSVMKWDDIYLSYFNLVVFLFVPKKIRMQRIKNREFERYGDIIYTDPERSAMHNDFIAWAEGYDDNTTSSRSLQSHNNWLKQLSCPVLEIIGDTTVEERLNLVIRKIEEIA